MSLDDLTRYFDFLDGLRESGRTNMYGAGPYLQKQFHLPQVLAQRVCHDWRRTFNSKQTARERAAQVAA